LKPSIELTRRSSRLPKVGADVLGFESVFLGSDCFGGGVSLVGSGFFSCDGGGGVGSSFGVDSPFFEGPGSEDVD
jgi:hypothetical protein